MGLNKGASGASSVFLITWWKTYSQPLFVGLINAAESFEEYVYLAHGIYIDVYPMNYREQDWLNLYGQTSSVYFSQCLWHPVFPCEQHQGRNLLPVVRMQSVWIWSYCTVCSGEGKNRKTSGFLKTQIFLTLMSYAGNAHVCFKHQMLLSSLFLIWEEGNMDVVLDRSTGRT